MVRAVVPVYGQRNGWRPTSTEDFGAYPMLVLFVYSSEQLLGDGGAYPECHIAQYPLGMGTKKVCGTTCVQGDLYIQITLGIFWQYSSFTSGQ